MYETFSTTYDVLQHPHAFVVQSHILLLSLMQLFSTMFQPLRQKVYKLKILRHAFAYFGHHLQQCLMMAKVG
jgi:hypothetical protein